MEFKEIYEKAQQQYKLPSFDQLNSSFNICSLEPTELSLLSDLLKHIVDYLEYYEKIIYNLIEPEASLASLHEAKVFSEEERKDIIIVYKQLMHLQRSATFILLKNDKNEQALFISKITLQWQELREKILIILEKIRDSWLKEEQLHEDLGYLG
ncbi:hypothetical protein HYY69_07700 [Candidatus Woesearchaeota archaeon]|nr:hypothetical protein [Candidatus Woesearchaeota archaeon]